MKTEKSKVKSVWQTDVRILLRQWGNDLLAFSLTLLLFVILALPVVIPAMLIWLLGKK